MCNLNDGCCYVSLWRSRKGERVKILNTFNKEKRMPIEEFASYALKHLCNPLSVLIIF